MKMPESEYALIFQGQVAAGSDVAEVKARFVALIGCGPEETEKLFSGRRLIFKRCASEDEAKEAAERFRQIGMVVEIQAVAPKSAAQPAPAPSASAVPPSAQATDNDAPAAPAARIISERQTVVRPAAKERRVPFVFSGSGSEFFKIWIVNVFLTILTLGIYSAWAKVRTLRYFYGNTSLDGSAFEYLAEPVKILKGRLIVLAFFAVFSVTGKFYPWINLLFWPVLLALTPWIIRQALRFRHHYTAWRGVRFAFAGNLGDAFRAFVLWPAFATLMFPLPVSWHRQTHYLMDNSRYGGTGFKNDSTVGDFFKIFGWLALWSILMGLIVAAVTFTLSHNFMPGLLAPPEVVGFAFFGMMLLSWLFIIPFYKVRTTNLRFGKTALGPHRLVSTYTFGSYLRLVISNTFAIMLTLGLFYPFAKVRTARYAAEHTAMIIDGDLGGFVADRQAEVSAVGSESGDFFDIDIGF